jgi:hypothetical protein
MKTLKLWLARFRKAKPRFSPARIDPDLDMASFREDEPRVAKMRELWGSDTFQQVLIVLHNARPRGYPPRGHKADALEMALELGRIQGAEDMLTLLELLTKPLPKQAAIHATWANPDEPETETEGAAGQAPA